MADKLVAGGSPTWHTVAAFSPASAVDWGQEVAERTDTAARELGLAPQSAEHVKAALAQAIKDGVPGSTQEPYSTCRQVCIHVLQPGEDTSRPYSIATKRPAAGRPRPAPGHNWGFFVVTRPTAAGDDGPGGEYAVELFLYPEGSDSRRLLDAHGQR